MRNRNIVAGVLFLALLVSSSALNNEVRAQNVTDFRYIVAQNTDQAPPSDEISKKYGFNLVQEMILGRSVAYGLLEKFNNRLYTDEKANKYVNLVGQSIAKSSSNRPQIKYKFGIIDTDEVNAFACPGGYVFVTKGLLAVLSNENEMAAVLAHEIGHIEHGDGLKDINEHKQDEYAKIKMDNLENDVATINDIATSLPYAGWYASYYSPKNMAKRGINSALGYIPGYGGYVASATVGVASDYAVDAASKGLKGLAKKIGEKAITRWYYKPLTPDCEYNADNFSVTALAKLGYDPKGIEEFLKTLKSMQSISMTGSGTGVSGVSGQSTDNSKNKNVFSYTHPPVESRISNAEKAANNPSLVVKNRNAANLPVFTERFNQNIAIME